MNGINLQREYFFKQDLLHRWRDAGVSEAQLDDWVTDGALRLALPARKIIGDGALGSILLDDFSTEAVSSITGHLAGLLNMSPQEIDDKILSPAGNQERLQGAKIEPLSATDYLYQTRWRHSVVADIYSRRSSGERKKTRHFATVFYDSKHRLRLLISGEQGGIYTVCGYSVSTEADYVFPLEEVVAFEARHAGGGPLPDNSGVEPYVPPPANQDNFTLGGDRNNRSESTATSPPQKQAEEGATVDQPAKFTDEQLLAYFRGSDTPYITGCAALEKAKLIRASYRKLRQEKGSEAPGADLHKMISAKHDRQRGFSVSSIRKSIKALDDAEKELACRAKPAPTS